MSLGLDISNYSGQLTQAQVACWAAQGVQFVIIGLQNAGIARQQQGMCRGFQRMYYVDLPGRDLFIPERESLVFVDIEPGCFEDEQLVAAEISRIGQHSLKPGIYGNETSIRPAIGTSAAYARFPLFYANYPASGQPPNFDTFPAFNGWTRPLIWQYKGTTELCGVNVDLDIMESAPVTESPSRFEQIDAVLATLSQINDYDGGKPILPLTAAQAAALSWLNEHTLKE